MGLVRHAITRTYAASLAGSARRFAAATQDVKAAQATRKQAITARLQTSEYGKRVGLGSRPWDAIATCDYEDLRGDIERVMAGEQNVLSRDEALRFEASGGSTGPGKLLPITAPFLAELQAGVNAWLATMYREHPQLHGGQSYWSITPGGARSKTTAGIPIGGDDVDYLGPVARLAWRQLMAVPQALARTEPEDWAYETLFHLAQAPDLRLVSVWSPTLWLNLLDALEPHEARLRAELPARHARRLQGDGPTWRRLWPNLSVISCWADGPSEAFAKAFRQRMPGVLVQPKGLLATEGVVSVPVAGNVAAVNSHVLEFEDDEGIHPLHAIESGRQYRVVLSTSAGLLRYRLGDVVEVVGHHHATPKLRFIGRDTVVDLVGEKLHCAWADACWRRVQGDATFGLLVPHHHGRGYHLYVETRQPEDGSAADRIGQRLEACLLEDHGYAYARRIGQLSAITVSSISGGIARWQDGCIARGQRLGDAKWQFLQGDVAWHDAMGART